MLDGKRYYAAFPDEDSELQPPLRAVLDALGKLESIPNLADLEPPIIDPWVRANRAVSLLRMIQ